jgi:predicted glycoside hydrolase/deacetylase ChbG (UPF0249 family)
MILEYIITADDFGISPGVNDAIIKAYNKGNLTHTSIMTNMLYFQDAIQKRNNKAKKLNIGLHLNLTTGKALTDITKISFLVDEKGFFKHNFLGLLLLPFFKNKKKLQKQVEIEIENQIKYCLKNNIKLSHLDGHKHIHTIPWIFQVVKKIINKYNIPRIRIINENIFKTFILEKKISLLLSSSIIKYTLLKLFYYLNKYRSYVYFFSILYSCKLNKKIISKISKPAKYKLMEIMIHPGIHEIDKKIDDKNYIEKNSLLKDYRKKEFEILLNLKTINSIFK